MASHPSIITNIELTIRYKRSWRIYGLQGPAGIWFVRFVYAVPATLAAIHSRCLENGIREHT
jgi:hypothetical protein